MKKYLLFGLPIVAVLPLASLVSCSNSDDTSNLPSVDENGNGQSDVKPNDVLDGDTSNMTIAELKAKLTPELTEAQKKEVAKIKSSITNADVSTVLASEVTKDNYQNYFSTNATEKNTILSSALSNGYSIETTFFNYENSDYYGSLSIYYLLKLKNSDFEYKGSFRIEGFKKSNSQPESTTKDKEKFLNMIKAQEDSLKSMQDLPNWYFNPDGQNFAKANELLGLTPSYKQQISEFSYYFTKENADSTTYQLSLKADVSNNENLATLMNKQSEVELKFWVENGMFAPDGKANPEFRPPRLKEDGSIDWTVSTVTDEKIKESYQNKVKEYNEWLKEWSKTNKTNVKIFSAPIKFKAPTEATIKVQAKASFDLANFEKATTAESRLAMFEIVQNENETLDKYYSDATLSSDKKSVTFTVKSESIVVGDKKTTYYKVGNGVDIPQLKLDLPINNPDQGTNPENNPDNNQGNDQGTNPDNNQGSDQGTNPDNNQGSDQGTKPENNPDNNQGNDQGTKPENNQGNNQGTTKQ